MPPRPFFPQGKTTLDGKDVEPKRGTCWGDASDDELFKKTVALEKQVKELTEQNEVLAARDIIVKTVREKFIQENDALEMQVAELTRKLSKIKKVIKS